MTIFTYPIFLLLFIFLLTRRYRQMSILQWIGRWLLGIGFAYAATFGLLAFSLLIFGSSPGYGFRWFDHFTRHGLALAFIFTILGILLFLIDRFRGQSGRRHLIREANPIISQRAVRILSLLLVSSLFLIAFLLLGPYFDYQVNCERMYSGTHISCFDPISWPPFAWVGLGSILYMLSFVVWAFAVYFLLPFALAQIFLLNCTWPKLPHISKITHTASAVTSVLTALLILMIGPDILDWLLD